MSTRELGRPVRAPRLPGPVRRDQVLETACAIFAEHGFDRSSIEQIAEAAGVSKPVVYEHFANKTELFVAVRNRELERALSYLPPPGAGDPGVEIERSLAGFFRYVADNPDGGRVLMQSGETGNPESLAVNMRVGAKQLVPTVHSYLEMAGLPTEHAVVFARAVIGMAVNVALCAADDGHIDADGLAATLTRLLLEGTVHFYEPA